MFHSRQSNAYALETNPSTGEPLVQELKKQESPEVKQNNSDSLVKTVVREVLSSVLPGDSGGRAHDTKASFLNMTFEYLPAGAKFKLSRNNQVFIKLDRKVYRRVEGGGSKTYNAVNMYDGNPCYFSENRRVRLYTGV